MDSLDRILDYFIENTNFTKDEILGTWRKRELVEVRHLFSYLSYNYTRASLLSISEFCNRDHSTILYGIRVSIDCLLHIKECREFIYKAIKDLDLEFNYKQSKHSKELTEWYFDFKYAR